jgi:hypothetical protein
MPVLPLKTARHVAGPLVEHEQAHVTKHAGHEDNLGQKLAEYVCLIVKIFVVPQGQENAEEHVDDAENDGDLHLEGVQEDDLVGGDLPDGVDAERIGGAVVAAAGQIAFEGRVNHDGSLAQHLLSGHRHLPGGPDHNEKYIRGSNCAWRRRKLLSSSYSDLDKPSVGSGFLV